VEPPILPNIFNSVVPLRGAAAARARKHLATLKKAPKINDGAKSTLGMSSVYRNMKVLPGDVTGKVG